MKTKVIIIGAGLTGLSTAYHLDKMGIDYLLFEKECEVGGLCRSKNVNGFIFDYAEHFLRIPDSYVKNIVDEVLPDILWSQKPNAAIYIYDRYIKYPFQKNLGELPPEVLKECVLGFIEQYCKRKGKISVQNFEDWILRNFGNGIARHFMLPYNEKIWTVLPKNMSLNWFMNKNIVSSCTIDDILEGALYPVEKRKNQEIDRWYPLSGGVGVIPKAFSSRIKNIHLNSPVTKVNLKEKKITLQNNVTVDYKLVVSTIPINELKNVVENLPIRIYNTLSKLKSNSVVCVNLGVDRGFLSDKHWIYFPEKRYIFSRLYFPMNFSPNMVPDGKSSVSAIITYSDATPLEEEQNIVERVIEDLRKANILKNDDKIIVKDVMKIRYGFTIPDLDRDKNVDVIQTYLRENDFFSIGRYGEWKYSGMEHAIMDGKNVAEKVKNI